jgi:hypothetical protein
VPKLIAEWNTDLKLWSKPTGGGLFFERLELFSATWPKSGMTQNGQAFELPMQALPIKDLESLSLHSQDKRFATPNTMDSLPPRYGEAYERVKNAGGRKNRLSSGNLREQVVHLLPIPDLALLRSPTASQGQGGALGEEEARKRGNTVGIRDQAMDLAKLQGHKVSRKVANLPDTNLSVPTPTASDGSFDKPGLMRKITQVSPNRGVGLPLWANRITNEFYLPTPNTMEHREVKTPEQIAELKAKSPGGYRNLRETVINELPIMPTPKALDGVKGNLKTSKERIDSGHQVDLPNVAIDLISNTETNWGKFEAAIRRWELVIGRPAPEPTKPDGKDGNHRLSSKFTEWMMGLPDGWITRHGLKRNDELKLAGNGVVPQQAELALRILLDLPKEKNDL